MTRRAPPVLHDAYDLALALYRVVPGFPKTQRFVLGQRIEQCAVDLLFRIDAAREALKRACRSERSVWFAKCDIRGYFPSVRHDLPRGSTKRRGLRHLRALRRRVRSGALAEGVYLQRLRSFIALAGAAGAEGMLRARGLR